jgi:hypothetical protein
LGAIKPKVLNIIAKIDYGHLCLREENLSLNNNYMIYIKYSDFKVTLSRTIFVSILKYYLFIYLYHRYLPWCPSVSDRKKIATLQNAVLEFSPYNRAVGVYSVQTGR